MYCCESTGMDRRMIDDVAMLLPQFAETPYVLVIEDDQAVLSVILLLLETEDYAGIGLMHSAEVMTFLEQIHAQGQGQLLGMHLPSVILLDLMMPVLSGYELASLLAACPWTADIPIVVMTADVRVSNEHAIPGAVNFIRKPFQISDLLSKLEPYIERVIPSEMR